MSEKNVEEVKSLLKEIKSKFFESYVDYLFDDEKCNSYWNQLEEELQLGLSNVINSIPSFNDDISKPGLDVVRSDREFVMTPISAYSEMSILTDDIMLDYVNLHNILEYELSIDEDSFADSTETEMRKVLKSMQKEDPSIRFKLLRGYEVIKEAA